MRTIHSLDDGADGPALFRALLAGEFSLVGSTAAEDWGHYVARRNEPGMVAERALSPDEAEVVLAVLSGDTYGSIAAALGVAPSTVATRLKRALVKLRIQSRAQLIAVARRLGAHDG